MRFIPKPQLRSAFSDVASVVRAPAPHKLGALGLSAVLSFLLIGAFVHDLSPAPAHQPVEIIYIKQWPKSRSLAQIKAQMAIDAPLEKAAAAKDAADDAKAAADRRAQFKRAQEVLSSYGIK